LISGNSVEANNGFLVTLGLAVLFTLLQIGEYLTAPFNISDSIYGSVFYSLTGLHGLHVIIGSIFIGVCYVRFLNDEFTVKHHLGFEFAS
jgi:heme/copper-type cytochrome/quinol oxidase subunit 3